MYKSEFFIRCDLRAFAKVNDYAILLAEYIHNSSKWILKIFIETSSSRAAQDHNLAYYSYISRVQVLKKNRKQYIASPNFASHDFAK
jgi:hypothetical protein